MRVPPFGFKVAGSIPTTVTLGLNEEPGLLTRTPVTSFCALTKSRFIVDSYYVADTGPPRKDLGTENWLSSRSNDSRRAYVEPVMKTREARYSWRFETMLEYLTFGAYVAISPRRGGEIWLTKRNSK